MDTVVAGLIYILTYEKPPNSLCNIPCATYPGEYCGGTAIAGVAEVQTYYQNVCILSPVLSAATATVTTSVPTNTASPYCSLGCYSDGDTYHGSGSTGFAPLFPGLALGVQAGLNAVFTQINVYACLQFCCSIGLNCICGHRIQSLL